MKHDTFFKAAIIMGKAYVMAEEAMHPWIKDLHRFIFDIAFRMVHDV